MKLKCYHCGYVWNFKGKQPYFATCPRCNWRLRIKRARREARGAKG